MNRGLTAIIGFCALLSANAATAQTPQGGEITVHVSSQRMALAVAPVHTSDAALAADIDKVLNHTLQLTGLFDFVPQASLLPGLVNETMASTNYGNWYISGAQVVVKGDCTVTGDSIKLDLGLFDAAGNKRIELSYSPKSMNKSKYNQAVYEFVNAVVAFFTGEPGFFGQSLLAVTREGRGKGARVVSMLTDGAGVSRVTRSNAIEMLPAWGPGGTVLLTSYAKNNPDLYLVSGGAGRRISAEPGMNSGASYCAGNGRIVLTLSKDGNAEIYSMAGDGSDARRLTDNRSIDTSPTWSPDCSKIAFVSDRGGTPQIYSMNADGSGVTRLTTVGKYNANPAWSKKGYIAFSGRDEQNNLDIFVMKDDGSELMRITQQQGKNDKPTWSPDGRYLAFSSTRDGASRIYISTADGKSQNPATTTGWYENPVWGH